MHVCTCVHGVCMHAWYVRACIHACAFLLGPACLPVYVHVSNRSTEDPNITKYISNFCPFSFFPLYLSSDETSVTHGRLCMVIMTCITEVSMQSAWRDVQREEELIND